MSVLTERIRSRGHWAVSIRPLPYQADRVKYGELLDLLERAAVRMRGWPVPYVDRQTEPIRSDRWIGQDLDTPGMEFHQEAWRFFMSGQFNHLRVVAADWGEEAKRIRIPDGFDAVVQVWEILFYLTEVFELASRLALGAAGDEVMSIEVRLSGLKNRGLVVRDQRRAEFFQPYRSQLDCIDRAVELPREELVAEGPTRAVDLSIEIFERFGWDASAKLLSDYQRELTERR